MLTPALEERDLKNSSQIIVSNKLTKLMNFEKCSPRLMLFAVIAVPTTEAHVSTKLMQFVLKTLFAVVIIFR